MYVNIYICLCFPPEWELCTIFPFILISSKEITTEHSQSSVSLVRFHFWLPPTPLVAVDLHVCSVI